MSFDVLPALPELFLLIAGLGLLVFGVVRDEDASRLVTPLAALALVIALILVLGRGMRPALTFGGHFVFDGYAAFLKVIIYASSAAALIMGRGFMRDGKIDRFEYPVLALFATLGAGMMVSANSLIALYMSLELLSLPLYVMAAIDRESLRSTEAGLKYFLLGALASGILLYGCSLVYGFTGTLFFSDLAHRLGPGTPPAGLPLGVLVGLVFVTAGLAFKMAAVPFHMWTPDVYEGSPSAVTAFFAVAPKVAAIGLTVRVMMEPFGAWVGQWQQIIIVVSILSMALSAFAAIGQTNFKRLMAYSSFGHVGYALVGLAAGTQRGVQGVLIYMAIYLAMTLGTFACILMMRRHGRYIETIDDLAGLSRRQPLMALALAIFMFSLAGIPPLAGFFGKLYVFLAAIDAGLIVLAVIGVLTSVVGAYYYLRIVKLMYFDEPAEAFDATPDRAAAVVAGVTAVLVLGFLALPAPLLSTATAAAQAIAR